MNSADFKVVMLPTELLKPPIAKVLPYNKIVYFTPLMTIPDNSEDWIGQHVYFVSEEPIADEDWIINGNIGRSNHAIFQVQKGRAVGYNEIAKIMEANKLKSEKLKCLITKKIVATTDESLGLPLIPLEWLRTKYVPANGKIDKVSLKMTEDEDLLIPELYTISNEVVIVDDAFMAALIMATPIKGMEPSNPRTVKVDAVKKRGGMPVESNMSYCGGFSEDDISDLATENIQIRDAAKKYREIMEISDRKGFCGWAEIDFKAGWKANPKEFTEDDMKGFAEYLTGFQGYYIKNNIDRLLESYKKKK